jgi:IclR family pca regulon transcriptional regulator
VPIRGANGTTAAALNTSGYSGMVTPDLLVQQRLPDLQATAARIAVAMARYPILESILATV